MSETDTKSTSTQDSYTPSIQTGARHRGQCIYASLDLKQVDLHRVADEVVVAQSNWEGFTYLVIVVAYSLGDMHFAEAIEIGTI